jgi:hypothetical protein
MRGGHHLESQRDLPPCRASVCGREEEMHQLRERLAARHSFLLHGPAGVGKTLLLSELLPDVPKVLYSPQNPTPQVLYRNLAVALLADGWQGIKSVETKTAVALKGVVRDAVRNSEYLIVADHLQRPSQALAASIRELMLSCSVPVVAVSRSDHMEDAGFVLHLFSDRKDKFAIRNFDPDVATRFAKSCVERERLQAENVVQFVERIVEFSNGNPGAIEQMIRMAKSAKYSHQGQIKVTPLYIDYKLAMVAY